MVTYGIFCNLYVLNSGKYFDNNYGTNFIYFHRYRAYTQDIWFNQGSKMNGFNKYTIIIILHSESEWLYGCLFKKWGPRKLIHCSW